MDSTNTEHKANILLVGFSSPSGLESLPGVALTNCSNVKKMTELVIANDYRLIISKFKVEDNNAMKIYESLESIKFYYTNCQSKNFKLLILTSSSKEDAFCKQNKLLYFPVGMNLKSLVLKLIDLPGDPERTSKIPVIIDFKELFARVDNNKEFIKQVIEKFFAVKESRISDIRTPLKNGDYKKAKDAAHKLKGVLANFSMLDAKATIIELERIILSEDRKAALKKLEELIEKIEMAKEFYFQNRSQFNE